VKYEFKGTSIEIPNPEALSNTERAMLREMALPGNPLWKIFRSMVDYGESLSKSLVTVDLTDPASVNAARTVQATILAVQWVQDTFAQALSDVEEESKDDE
jgi:hypothetical protein